MIDELFTSLHTFSDMILKVDKDLFHLINQIWINSIFDHFFPWITDYHNTKWFIAFVALVTIWKMKARSAVVLLGCALSILVADVTAARVLKPMVHRNRPEISETNVRLLVPSQSSWSFPSNHSANMFAVATFLGIMVTGTGPFAMLLAFLIAYSRVYVGVHFPLDVIGGGVLGFISGLLVYYLISGVHSFVFPEALRHLPKAWKKKKYGSRGG